MARASGTAVPGRLRTMSWRIALLFFAITLVTRLPFQTENLWAHDSVLYERAIERFDPLDQRPQPPGYLYYVLVIRGLDALTGDANRAMTVVSLVADALAVALLYLLAARLYDERTARIAALFLLSAVTFWAYGGIAYPYTLLAALSIGCALLFWRAATGSTDRARALLVASAAWGVAIGFRSDLAIFLAPLWLVAAWGGSLAGAALGAVTVVALAGVWYLASAAADGGLARFAEALRMQGQFVDERYSVFGANGLAALYANLYELGRFLGRGLYFLAPLVVAAPLSESARHIELADRRRVLFVTAWTLAPLLVYVPIHSGEYGYVFSMVPGLCVFAARGAIALARSLRMPRTLPLIVGAVVLANAAIFLVSDTPLSATDVIRQDRGTVEKYRYLQSSPDLDRASILAGYDALVAQRYNTVGNHNLYGYDPAATPPFEAVFSTQTCGPDMPGFFACSHAPILVIWDDLIRVQGSGWETVTMPHGAKLRIARDVGGVTIRVDGLEVTLKR
jgi:4-amino-4-deoxy-L-arabinose transferase-like glycosyltransferase